MVVCADVGSTFTKVVVVDLAGGALVGAAAHRTTADTDVLDGLAAAVSAAGGDGYPLRVCSSAGGGLRLAVVGYERLVTASAGERVGLSAGARVVRVCAGPLDASGVAGLVEARPDVVLLVGGTDGGDAQVLTHNAARLARMRPRVPVVAAGNAEARDEVVGRLTAAGVPVVAAGNVLPRIGVLDAGPARAAIREVFLRHVIGGKRLSRGRRFASLVRGATPEVVLGGVELLGETLDGDLAVVDVGGATTDVYSVLAPDEGGAAREVAGTLWRGRTVEGDLGMRVGAAGVVEAAAGQRLLADGEREVLAAAAAARVADAGLLPVDAAGWAVDARLAGLATTVALRRHARPGPDGGTGRDLRGVRLLIGSGGVLRHGPPGLAGRVLAEALGDHGGGWAPPRSAQVVVDVDGVLAAAGLLAADHPDAAAGLLRSRLSGVRFAAR
ncbi:glutamate mutase L [Rugosimonospora acidiphila]|uniref:glutamate mutase L n=1 Tax=Rugosimonospora acidiphila TaxID=556531 RepID=UPI0031E717B4